MEIATGNSTHPDEIKAVNTAWAQIIDKLNHQPVLLICSASANYSAITLQSRLTELIPKNCHIAASSSCFGAMNNNGYHSSEGYGLGLIAFSEDEGGFGIGLCSQADNPEQAAAQAIQDAINDADRPGELPDLVWINAAPGEEEAVLDGIASVIGRNVPVIGGSSADNTISGDWWQFNRDNLETDGVLLIAMYPQCQVALSFHSGYTPTRHSGTVTRANGRIIEQIDNQPAAEVYNNWTQGLVETHLSGGSILQVSTFQPLVREAGQIENVPYYALLHPEQILDNGSIRLFARINPGERLTLMSGSPDSLSNRAGSVASGILERQNWHSNQLAGALIVYCAGCMLGIQSRMDEVAKGLHNALDHAPFHGMFTFGEQGCFIDGLNRHGNLMISVLVFTRN